TPLRYPAPPHLRRRGRRPGPHLEAGRFRRRGDAAFFERGFVHRPVARAAPVGAVIRLLHRGDRYLQDLRVLLEHAVSRAPPAADDRAALASRSRLATVGQPAAVVLRASPLLPGAWQGAVLRA